MKKQDKLQAILNFLNGELSFESKPKNYIVFQTNDVYNLDGINMSEDEFKAWQQKNITDQDSLLIFQGQLAANSPEAIVKEADPNFFSDWLKQTSRDIDLTQDVDQLILSQIESIEPKETEPEMAQPQPKVIEAKEQPKKRRKKRIKKVSIEPIELVVPELKTSGPMSQYGITWMVSDRSLYN